MNLFHPKSWNKTRMLDIIFLTYILTLIILLVIPTNTGIKLNAYILGIRTDHFIHASLFLPFLPYFRLKLAAKVTFKIFLKFYLMGVLFAVFCESLQLMVPYRSFDPTDIVANVTGMTIGGLAFLWKSKPKKNEPAI